jgi:hypothetical protein
VIPDPAHRPLLSVAEAREALGDVVGRSAFYESIRRGDVPGVIRLGRRVFVSTAALRQWVGLEDESIEALPNDLAGPVVTTALPGSTSQAVP